MDIRSLMRAGAAGPPQIQETSASKYFMCSEDFPSLEPEMKENLWNGEHEQIPKCVFLGLFNRFAATQHQQWMLNVKLWVQEIHYLLMILLSVLLNFGKYVMMCVSSRKKTGVEASVMSGFGALLEGERRQGFDVMLQSWAGEQRAGANNCWLEDTVSSPVSCRIQLSAAPTKRHSPSVMHEHARVELPRHGLERVGITKERRPQRNAISAKPEIQALIGPGKKELQQKHRAVFCWARELKQLRVSGRGAHLWSLLLFALLAKLLLTSNRSRP
ncbi:hypothetical protein Anapl_17614 [Anas platyrhynchos]|uniref:Uncharacterized protein n=1 Tax=Anas platyrhynchos TaxID=8839 RepID=R0JHW1_ANAPL|nr:hypothetical protein Anapl_17614 [Anas platyrhynchos]